MSELHPSAQSPKSDPDRRSALSGQRSTLTPPRAALSSQRSALNFLPRLRESLALRLAAQYALVFALSSGILFGVLYWTLAESLNARELAGLERQVRSLADAFTRGSPVDVIARVKNNPSPEMSASFVRLIAPDSSTFSKNSLTTGSRRRSNRFPSDPSPSTKRSAPNASPNPPSAITPSPPTNGPRAGSSKSAVSSIAAPCSSPR